MTAQSAEHFLSSYKHTSQIEASPRSPWHSHLLQANLHFQISTALEQGFVFWLDFSPSNMTAAQTHVAVILDPTKISTNVHSVKNLG
jgi:hypothetical protein